MTAENIRADAVVDGAPFQEWKRIIPIETIVTTLDVSLAQNETGEIWFAFYQTLPPSVSIAKIDKYFAETGGKWVNDDYCGTPYPHHIGPEGPIFQLNLPSDITNKLDPAQKEKLQGYVKEYPAIAKAAFSEMTKVSDILKGVGQILSGTKENR